MFPKRDGIIRAVVLRVIALSTLSASMTYVPGTTSTNTGVSPFCRSGASVVEKVNTGVITSEPAGRSSTSIASRLADEPELTMMPCAFPNSLATERSNFFTFSPGPILSGFDKTAVTAAISSLPYTAEGDQNRTAEFFFVAMVLEVTLFFYEY